ncbi:hypothetical protein LTR10_000070 [Elasticomyces elasticus]|nr:hypothetical protein LTR10_000070 [Elasticomyces elasticus]KAK4980671.1 hypothetical protein LTR42_000980 [Elasticomyces elasticus]
MATINTTINYYLDAARGGGDTVFRPGTVYDKLRKHDIQAVEVRDIRGQESQYDLDTCGFQLVQHRSIENEFEDEEKIKGDVYAETAELLKTVTGATKVLPFSHIIRRQAYSEALKEAKSKQSLDDIVRSISVAMFAHVDQSYDGAYQVLRDNVSPASDAERLSECRFGIINVWRPIRIPVPREPLGVCDARSVPDEDLVEVFAKLPEKGTGTFENVSKGNGFGLWNVKYNPSHKWYYASGMRPEEVLMIKCFDSKKDGRARRSPHGAFRMDGQDERAPARESIEVRCLVFWEDQRTE